LGFRLLARYTDDPAESLGLACPGLLTRAGRGSRVPDQMPARFQVKHSFAIERRHLFVLVGTPVEGAVAVGMHAAVPVGPTVSLAIPIHGVEVVRRGGSENLALTSRY